MVRGYAPSKGRLAAASRSARSLWWRGISAVSRRARPESAAADAATAPPAEEAGRVAAWAAASAPLPRPPAIELSCGDGRAPSTPTLDDAGMPCAAPATGSASEVARRSGAESMRAVVGPSLGVPTRSDREGADARALSSHDAPPTASSRGGDYDLERVDRRSPLCRISPRLCAGRHAYKRCSSQEKLVSKGVEEESQSPRAGFCRKEMPVTRESGESGGSTAPVDPGDCGRVCACAEPNEASDVSGVVESGGGESGGGENRGEGFRSDGRRRRRTGRPRLHRAETVDYSGETYSVEGPGRQLREPGCSQRLPQRLCDSQPEVAAFEMLSDQSLAMLDAQAHAAVGRPPVMTEFDVTTIFEGELSVTLCVAARRVTPWETRCRCLRGKQRAPMNSALHSAESLWDRAAGMTTTTS